MAYMIGQPNKNIANSGAMSSQNVSTPGTPPVHTFSQYNNTQQAQNGAPGVATQQGFNQAPGMNIIGGAVGQANGAVQGALGQVQGAVQGAMGQVNGALGQAGVGGQQWPQLALPNFDITGMAPDQIRTYLADYKTQLMDAINQYRTGIMGVVGGLRQQAPVAGQPALNPTEPTRPLTLEDVLARRGRRNGANR